MWSQLKIGLLVFVVLAINGIAASQTRELKMQHGKTTIYSIRYLPDGKRFISASYDGSIVMWDIRSGKRVWHVDLDAASKSNNSRTISSIRHMDLSPEGSMVAISYYRGHVVGDTLTGEDECHIALLDSGTGQVTRTLTGHTFLIGELAFSPNGELLLSESGERTARLWNVNTGQEVLQIKLKEKGARVAFSPDGKVVAVATQPVWGSPPQPIVGLFDARTGQLLREFPRSKAAVVGLAFSPDGQTVAIAGGDSIGAQIDLWELAGQEPKITFPMPRHEINVVRFSPDGRLLAVCGYGKGKGFIEVRTISANEPAQTFIFKEEVSALDFSPIGKQLVIGNEKGQITVIRAFRRSSQLDDSHTKPQRSRALSGDKTIGPLVPFGRRFVACNSSSRPETNFVSPS